MNRVRGLMETCARRPSLAWLVALIATACLAGCGVRQRAAPLDVELAREVLKTSLEAWKKGDSPDTLKNGSPSIIAQDPDWVTGAGSSPTRWTATTSALPRISSFRSS